MAQSTITVTPPNPTPPTNMSCTGATPPNVPNYTRQTYNDPKNWSWVNPKDFPPPYFDDGTAGSLTAFAAATAALASGTSAADNAGGTAGAGAGGTGINNAVGTYPGATSGLVPASSSTTAEGAGTEVVVTKVSGSGALDYNPATFLPMGTSQMITVGTGPVQTAATLAAGPNASHASSLSPAANPTLATATPSTASGTGNATVTATGTGFTRQSVIWVNGIAYPTTYVSATSLTASAPKKATAGTLPVKVVTGGVVETATVNWTFT